MSFCSYMGIRVGMEVSYSHLGMIYMVGASPKGKKSPTTKHFFHLGAEWPFGKYIAAS